MGTSDETQERDSSTAMEAVKWGDFLISRKQFEDGQQDPLQLMLQIDKLYKEKYTANESDLRSSLTQQQAELDRLRFENQHLLETSDKKDQHILKLQGSLQIFDFQHSRFIL